MLFSERFLNHNLFGRRWQICIGVSLLADALLDRAVQFSCGGRSGVAHLDFMGLLCRSRVRQVTPSRDSTPATADAVIAGMKESVGRLHAALPGVRVIGATLTSALGSSDAAHGSPEQDGKRRALDAFIRSSGLFDAVANVNTTVPNPATGGLRPEFVSESTTGGSGDKPHPNWT